MASSSAALPSTKMKAIPAAVALVLANGVFVAGNALATGPSSSCQTTSATVLTSDTAVASAAGPQAVCQDVNVTVSSTGTISATTGAALSYLEGPFTTVGTVSSTFTGTGNLASGKSLLNQGSIVSVNAGSSAAGLNTGVNVVNEILGSITNAGVIAGKSTVSGSSSTAYGIREQAFYNNWMNGALHNTGTITAVAVTQDYTTTTGTVTSTYMPAGRATARAIDLAQDLGVDGVIINSGLFKAVATAANNIADAIGLNIGNELLGSVSNTGTIAAIATGSDATARGVSEGVNNRAMQGTLNNAGLISAQAEGASSSSASGLYFVGDVADTALISNSGQIAGAATASTSSGAASAEGVYVGRELLGTVRNSGSISAVATANTAYAVGVKEVGSYGLNMNGSLTNTGLIQSRANGTLLADARAMDLGYNLGSSGEIANAGSMSAVAIASTSYGTANATGLNIGNELFGSVSNSGSLSALADGANAYAYGVRERAMPPGYMDGVLTNSGMIRVTANATTQSGAYGISLANGMGSAARIANTGTIDVAAVASTASGAYVSATAYGIDMRTMAAGAQILNTGLISAVADGAAGSSTAYGVNVGTMAGVITNTGSISAYATNSGYVNSSSSDIPSTVTGTAYSVYVGTSSGTLGGLVSNSSTGILDGAVRLGGVIGLTNDGLLNTYYNQSTVGGAYTQGATGALVISATSSTIEGYGRLLVGGQASLASGTQIRVAAPDTHSFVAGQTVVGVISAGTLSGSAISNSTVTGIAVKDNILALNFTAVRDNSEGLTNQVNLVTSTDTTMTTVASIVGGTGTPLDTMLANPENYSPEVRDLLYAIGASNNAQEVRNRVAQTQPLMTTGVTQSISAASRGTARIIQARQEGQNGRSSGDTFYGDGRVWFKPFGSLAQQDDRDGVSGYKARTYGAVFGVDAQVSPVDRLGIALSYASTDVNGNASVARHDADVKSYQFVVYGSHSLSDATDLSFQADIGRHNNDGRRQVDTGGPILQAKSDYKSWSGHVGVGLGHTMPWGEKLSLTPSIRLDYSSIKDGGYTESGAGGWNLTVNSKRTQELVASVDGKFVYELNDKTSLTGNAGVGYDFNNKRASLTAAYAGLPGATFATTGIDASPWLARGGLGVITKLNETMELSARYDAEARSGFTNQTGSVKLRMAF